MDMEGDVLAIARCHPGGGEVRLHGRNVGGTDQWEAFAVISDPRRGFGFSLDLDQGRLAIGIRGGATWSSAAGAVQVLQVDPTDVLQPVVSWGEFHAENATAGDLFGHSVLWQGDTLFVGATGRSHAKGNGAVYVFHVYDQQLVELGMIQPDPLAFQLEDMRLFGSSMACDGQHLVVSSPLSGFSTFSGSWRSGALHVYDRSVSEPTGWAASSTLFDVFIPPMAAGFRTNDLGREGIFLVEGSIIAHSAITYSSYYGNSGPPDYTPFYATDENGDDMPHLAPACEPCRSSVFHQGLDGQWSLDTTLQLPVGFPERSRSGWRVDPDAAFITGYDTTAQAWRTIIHQVTPGLSDWIVIDTLPGLDPCDQYNGPVVSSGERFARSALRKGTACTGTSNGHQLQVELFARTEAVGVREPITEAQIVCMPNPARDYCNLLLNSQGPWRLELIGACGDRIRSFSDVRGSGFRLQLAGVSPGLYVVRATNYVTSRTLATRLVIQ